MPDLTDLEVKLRFYWRTALRRQFPGYIGAVRVSIKPPAGISVGKLDRLVFKVPELYEDGQEVLRVDSFHYHRVVSPGVAIPSKLVDRNVLSFRLIQGAWRAGIFEFPGLHLKRHEIERRVRYGVITQIEEVIDRYMNSELPENRRLSTQDVKAQEVFVLLGIPEADDKRLFDSYV
ncbi:hypothetical protein DW355_06565 [Hylemonella gracilis]|uniref:Uncharacterized protein n=1 Tax=Hylemonella gracilis TaxID=80880 RepID=A0A4P6UHT5_9BURK|nr:hypothetical protein [Hylemonella gracilis]QBK04493.1 hypothetical protein DW355_06565 [Hylemonella gracilis]